MLHDPVIDGNIVTKEEGQVIAGIREMVHQEVDRVLEYKMSSVLRSGDFVLEFIQSDWDKLHGYIDKRMRGLEADLDNRIWTSVDDYITNNPPPSWWGRLLNWVGRWDIWG